MRNILCYTGVLVVLCSTLGVAQVAEPLVANSVSEAFQKGKPTLFLRYRFESVDQDGIVESARASTLRTRLGFETAKFTDFQAGLEFEDVQQIGGELYNDTINGKVNYPVVADPDSTEINQAFLKYSGFPQTSIKGGRRLLVLDDARFIGDVDWRQNSQTFDGVDVVNKSLEDFELYYGWIYQVNRVFGEDSEKGKFNSQSHLFNIKNTSWENNTVSLFSYLLDLENSDSLSSATYGARLDGKMPLNDQFNLIYEASLAKQTDYADNPTDYSTEYYHAKAGLGMKLLTASVGYEILGSDQGLYAFQTPLATLHKFNGWADLFLTTPENGIKDFYAKLDFNLSTLSDVFKNSSASAIYHDFQAEEGSDHYGQEWNFVWSQKVMENYSVDLHYANYRSIDFAQDTEKYWVSLSTKFST